MSKKIKYITLIISIILFLQSNIFSQNNLDEKISNLVNILENYHYDELKINDKIINEIKRNYLAYLDPRGVYFLDNDVRILISTPLSIGSGKSVSGPFIKKTAELFRQRLDEAGIIIGSILKTPLDYKSNDIFRIDNSNDVSFEKNKPDHLAKWKRLLKYEILSRFFYEAYNSKISNPDENFYSAEPEIRSSIERRESKAIDYIINHANGYMSFLSSELLNTIASRYDPHTMYLSSADKNKFESMTSEKAFSFGFYLKEGITGGIQIDRITPGGPAWKSGKINRDDYLLEVVFPRENGVKYDAADFYSYEIEEIIGNSQSNEMTVTIRKGNGLIEKVALLKEKIQVEENIVSSFVLKGECNIGYIYLPAFYAEWETSKPGCANDVAKEILKLKREKIQGLIFDLRGNQGGALSEAVDLASIFIDEGPFFIQKSRGEKPYLVKDPSRGTVYDGPLLVMAGGQSASASEFFISVMKDYNRAVITGGKTYGKASSQVILPVIKDINNFNVNELNNFDNDFVKITNSVYYDLSGNTHQGSGILPDISFINTEISIFPYEKDYKYTIKAEKIEKAVTYKKLPDIPRNELGLKSKKRISADNEFNLIENAYKKLNSVLPESGEVQLNIRAFFNSMKETYDLLNSLAGLFSKKTKSFKAENISYDADLIKIDTYRKIMNEESIKRIQEDIFINESYLIMNDYIKIPKDKD